MSLHTEFLKASVEKYSPSGYKFNLSIFLTLLVIIRMLKAVQNIINCVYAKSNIQYMRCMMPKEIISQCKYC